MMFGPVVGDAAARPGRKNSRAGGGSRQAYGAGAELPTMIESGMAGFEITSWYGLAAPAGTPKPAINRLNAETNKALQSAEVVAQFRLQGYEPIGGTPEAMNALIRSDVARWTTIIRDAGIEAQ